MFRFPGEYAGSDCQRVVEASRNRTVMPDCLEKQIGQVSLGHPLKARMTAEAKINTDEVDATALAYLVRI